MKPTLSNFLFAALVFGITMSCSKSKQSAENTVDLKSDSTKAEQTNDATPSAKDEKSLANGIVLKGIYATSTQIPSAKFSYKNLFDGNNDTYWSTMPGAGPDEGIMLYFDKPLMIDALEIMQPVAETIAPIRSFTIYTNGQKMSDRSYENNRLKLNASNVYSLFIRLDQFDEIEKSNKDEITITTFPEQMTAAISELRIILKGGVKVNIITPKLVKGTITASSTLAPALSYGVRNLFDARGEFAWAEGDKGNGIGQSLSILFQDEQTITALEIMNGYQRSEKHFTANTRAKTLLMSDESGKQSSLTLADDQGEQTALLSTPVKGKSIKIQVKDVYPGQAYKDMVISEVKFKNGDNEFILEDNITESLKSELLKKANGNILEKVLDRRVANEQIDMDELNSSLILRSDYTFVFYQLSKVGVSAGNETTETIADGNWEIKELSQDGATIRIFGKLARQSQTQNYYTGESSSDDLQIFQDVLFINNAGKISPQKFLTPLVFIITQK